MSTKASPAIAAAAAAPAIAARREIRHIALLLAAALAAGAAVQVVFGPGPRGLVIAAAASAVVTLVASRMAPGRWRDSLSGFAFAAVSTGALAAVAALGTIIVQDKPAEYYLARYGAVGVPIVTLRLDDVFHSLWFGALVGVFVAALVRSAAIRLPPRARSLGFLVCHAGLLTTVAGAAASTAFTTKGRLDLHAGADSATQVRVTGGGAGATGQLADLGFELRLDRFDLVNYEPELRIGYYEPADEAFRLRASFALDPGVPHALPRGNGFRVVRLDPNGAHGGVASPEAVLEVNVGGERRETPVLFAAREGSNYVRVPTGVLTFERRPDEAKAFVSHVTITDGDEVRQARIAVNEPFSFRGWTLYQARHDPRDRTYSGIDAVRDPGVTWVFAGFALIGVGVAWTFYADRFARTARPPAHHDLEDRA